VADPDRSGSPWTGDELDAIVADYFAMLECELTRRPYSKAEHRRVLVKLTGRSHGSVEFKHQNISAVLDALCRPWIPGYKPAWHFQGAIVDAVERHIASSGELYLQPETTVLRAAEDAATIFVPAPAVGEPPEYPPQLHRLVRKFDPIARDFRNRELGKAGEKYVMDLECKRLLQAGLPNLARKVRWVSTEDGDGAGYDILSFDAAGTERLIEVKTTNGGAATPFFLTRVERETSRLRTDAWRLYRVHRFAQTPRVFTITPPLEAMVHLRAEVWTASFGIEAQ
jgi:hypothetical protein